MTNLFIDTNVFLSFFSFSNDHLEKLEHLKDLIKKKDIFLFLPVQVADEFGRNREARLKIAIDHLEKFVPKLQIPSFCRDLQEMKAIQKLVEQTRDQSKVLIELLEKQISTKTLKADKLILEIFALSPQIPIQPKVLEAARTRFDRGNPPGKDRSYGDAINWEALLSVCPDKEDLYFVGGDKDFKSLLNPAQLSPYLQDEWRSKKKSQVHYFELISEFMKQKFAQIKITDDQIKEEKEAARQISLPSFLTAQSGSGYSGTFKHGGFAETLDNLSWDTRPFFQEPMDPATTEAILRILAGFPEQSPKKE